MIFHDRAIVIFQDPVQFFIDLFNFSEYDAHSSEKNKYKDQDEAEDGNEYSHSFHSLFRDRVKNLGGYFSRLKKGRPGTCRQGNGWCPGPCRGGASPMNGIECVSWSWPGKQSLAGS
jgi:hypothetical protein